MSTSSIQILHHERLPQAGAPVLPEQLEFALLPNL